MTSSAFWRTWRSRALDHARAISQVRIRLSPGWPEGTIIRFSSAVMLENSCAI
jgi:hypothetical protein